LSRDCGGLKDLPSADTNSLPVGRGLVSNAERTERINIENVYPLCGDLLANPRREIVARRIYFAVKQQSQT
jgi:hypothetical protein